MIEEILEHLQTSIKEFGGKENENYILRKNIKEDSLKNGGAYFGVINPNEGQSGPYHDFCIVVFPSEKSESSWILSLGIGSLGFRNDHQLALMPGLRRLFRTLVDEHSFVKTDFSDIETSIDSNFLNREDLYGVKDSLEKYKKVLPVCQILNLTDIEDSKNKISTFLAAYSKIRGWKASKPQKQSIEKALNVRQNPKGEDQDVIAHLLKTRKYIVLQGAPGTGKTRMAKKIAEHLKAKVFFTQFHAEVSYSDFIYGLRPKVNAEHLTYTENIGILPRAIEYANTHEENVVLIIDEINRANLSNVLGEVFYLFEYKQDDTDVKINITPSISLNRLPENLFVIATMNTSDRSLAVVDFALRRRFGWYTMMPMKLETKNFHSEDYLEFERMFNWHATTDELSLQPGHGYFLAESDGEMKDRIKYELLPLVREYLKEGYLQSAKEAFNSYFVKRINTSLFE